MGPDNDNGFMSKARIRLIERANRFHKRFSNDFRHTKKKIIKWRARTRRQALARRSK